MSKRCNGKTECQLKVEKYYSSFCECSIQKYLDISYKCVKQKEVKEVIKDIQKRHVRINYNNGFNKKKFNRRRTVDPCKYAKEYKVVGPEIMECREYIPRVYNNGYTDNYKKKKLY